jgi:nucleoid-associated protein YejK
MVQSNLNDNQRKALIFQRRQLQNEKSVEEIVRTNTEKVYNKKQKTFIYFPCLNLGIL